MNRLTDHRSCYLRQHADNPVDWWPWCDEAFAQARERNVPIMLSIGYAACHWCHVMAEESFMDIQIAAQLNENFVCIKVDREERPDVDAVYIAAAAAMTGQAGWPLTAFLTPDGAPFYCGTYFPPSPRPGIPAFSQVIAAVAEGWSTRGHELTDAGTQVVRALAISQAATPRALAAEDLNAAVSTLASSFDRAHGGFGSAPKFPPSMCLEFLLRHHARTGNRQALQMVQQTGEQMARGGIYDQLGGGFARYSVDAEWNTPHFEKMLYDNALLLRVYLHLWRATGDPFALRIATETADFLLRDLATDEGGFASSLDADTAAGEGAHYLWTRAEFLAELGESDGIWAADIFGLPTGSGHPPATLLLPTDPSNVDRWAELRARLFQARLARPQPARDDKIIASWNGLAIAALAGAGALLDEKSYLDAAIKCADLLLRVHWRHGQLLRTSWSGKAGKSLGILEDYANLAEGMLVLYQATGNRRWIETAEKILDVVLEHFRNSQGGFFDTADNAESLVVRPADPTDNATPSGSSAAAGALLTYAALTGSDQHRIVAEETLTVLGDLAVNQPRFAGWTCAVAEAALAGPIQIAVIGDGDLTKIARRTTSPGAVVLSGRTADADAPLLANKSTVDGRQAAYVCHGFVCAAPITDPDELAVAIDARPLTAAPKNG